MTYRSALRNWLTPMLYDVLKGPPTRGLLAWLWDQRVAPAALTEAEQWLLTGLLLEGQPGAPRTVQQLRRQAARLPEWWLAMPSPVAGVAEQALDALLIETIITPARVPDEDLALLFRWLDRHPLPAGKAWG